MAAKKAPKKARLPLSPDTNPRARKPSAPRTKKAPAQPAPAVEAPKPEAVPAVTMALTEGERLNIRMHLAEYRRFNAEASMRVMEKQALLRQLDPDNKLAVLDQGIRGASESATRAQQQYNGILAAVEKRLGVSIKDFSFDENTGQLWPHNAGPKE